MKVRPILFSGPMIRALLCGTKTQTRRAVKFPIKCLDIGCELAGCELAQELKRRPELCPYGTPGDLLYVRETTIRIEEHGYVGPVYAASDDGIAMLDWGIRPAPDDVCDVEPEDVRLRPAIHMPRAASRLTLRITDVRVERLQDISEEDAEAEGVGEHNVGCSAAGRYECRCGEDSYKDSYAKLWDYINGTGSWAANPWVWAITFEVINQNVDAYLATVKVAA